jgi:hypothetical protein
VHTLPLQLYEDLAVEANAGSKFIIRSLEQGQCDYDHLLPWIQGHLKKL